MKSSIDSKSYKIRLIGTNRKKNTRNFIVICNVIIWHRNTNTAEQTYGVLHRLHNVEKNIILDPNAYGFFSHLRYRQPGQERKVGEGDCFSKVFF